MFYFRQSTLSLSKKGGKGRKEVLKNGKGNTKGPRCNDLHFATGQLILGQVLKRCLLLATEMITNKTGNGRVCVALWMIAGCSQDAGCWMIAGCRWMVAGWWLIAGCCWDTTCWLIDYWWLKGYCLLDDCWLRLGYCLLVDCWLRLGYCLMVDCWLRLAYCYRRKNLWIFSGNWWFAAKLTLQAKNLWKIPGFWWFAAKTILQAKKFLNISAGVMRKFG